MVFLLLIYQPPERPVKNSPFCSFQPFFELTPLHPPLSERGGKGCPAMSYPLSRIERGTKGELIKIQ
jgi:hypothetical protein